MRTIERKGGRPLTIEEQRAWDELAIQHTGRSQYEMARALYEDVRPGWEAVPFAVPGPGPTLSDSDRMRCAMASALFDDVRPGWEAELVKAQERSHAVTAA
jgi:hypothetical protein